MSLTNETLDSFTRELGSRSPVPGGGGASALVASLGAALAAMVGNLTAGKEKFAAYEDELRELIAQAQALSEKLNRLIDADAEAFLPLSAVYAMPKEAPERAERMEQALRAAAEVPLEILRCACQGIELHARLETKCSALAVSDVATGVVFCWSALYGAAINVKVNTRLMTDRAYVRRLDEETERLMGTYWKMADEVYERIWAKLS